MPLLKGIQKSHTMDYKAFTDTIFYSFFLVSVFFMQNNTDNNNMNKESLDEDLQYFTWH